VWGDQPQEGPFPVVRHVNSSSAVVVALVTTPEQALAIAAGLVQGVQVVVVRVLLVMVNGEDSGWWCHRNSIDFCV